MYKQRKSVSLCVRTDNKICTLTQRVNGTQKAHSVVFVSDGRTVEGVVEGPRATNRTTHTGGGALVSYLLTADDIPKRG